MASDAMRCRLFDTHIIDSSGAPSGTVPDYLLPVVPQESGCAGSGQRVLCSNLNHMEALIVIDAQNEFSKNGKRPVLDFEQVVATIRQLAANARKESRPIAWVRHFNKPHESPAFVPNTWGSEFHGGLGPLPGKTLEKEFQKDVYGAFTGSNIGDWLKKNGIDQVFITGFYTHGCVSTTAREAIMRGFNVLLDTQATGTCDLEDPQLGTLSAEEVRRSALIQLANMGATILG